MTPRPAAETPPQDFETGINQLATIGRLLDHPELARVYVYVCYYGPVTRPQIKNALNIPKTTVYDHVETLERHGVITLGSGRPVEITAEPVRITTDGIMVTPTILHAIALQEVDEDISYFVERHGVGKLAAAIRQAGLHYADQITQRMAADPLEIPTGEAIRIILALKPALAVGQEYDPHFSDIFPEIAGDIEFDADIDVTAPLPDSES
ncbi:helix-turn-helix domain-containing protein [Halostagnicola sp. A-GB9-2]|uniref:helix-turn-helix domain-containing protein n=1 Tax=Halostagnicola sp. A-GB9-2 TaxID=3048066 RepID=UPI0024C0E176|nr:helix-turn-helix domain-containing protein [Halostagnicola sp. A-GB9-2]MDJ1434207.1 helix-turn-helix domain-containing protein [Halostagnicola sp. A-GB9-2]